MKFAELSDLNSLYEDGAMLWLDPHKITLDNAEYTRRGTERPRLVIVRHNGTRAGYYCAWSVVRRLVHSHRLRPAIVRRWEIEAYDLEIETVGPLAYLIQD